MRRRRNWLLIFDNAEDSSDLFPLLPDKHPGHVLVTSRRREWPYAETRHLDVLSSSAAVEYLRRRGQVADGDIARDIADALGYLPLALAQAGSVIADGLRAVDYRDLLRQHSPRLFAEGHAPDRNMTVATTWRVSVQRLAGRSSAALALFRISVFLGADAVPLARLAVTELTPPELAEALADPLRLRSATAALGEYSLAETAEGLLSIHRLVQAVTRSELGDAAPHWASIALATVAAAFPGNERDPSTWEDCEEVLAHAISCAGHAVELRTDTVVAVQLLNRVAGYLMARGRLDSAGAVLKQAFTAAEDLDHDHPVYLSCQRMHGRLLFSQGDYQASRTVQEEVYRARTRVLGPDDPDTLRAGRDLVEALYFGGHPMQAAQLHDRLVEAFNAVLGPDDLETVTAQAYLATILRSAGQYARARAIEEQVVEARIRVLGEDHPDTLDALGNLAATLYEQGELKRARAIEEQVLEARIRVQGKDHPDTLSTLNSLAGTLYEQGELKRARAIEEQVLEARIRVLGDDHPDTLDALSNVAETLYDQGELKRARAIEEQVLEARIRLLGEDHPDTLTVRASLAITLRDLGELAEALAIEEQVFEARIRVLGQDHPDTLDVRVDLAATYSSMGELDQARAIEEQVLDAYTRVLGPDHLRAVSVRASLAATLRALGKLTEARAIEEQVVQARMGLVGENHPATLAAKADLAVTLLAQGNNKEAISLLNECLDIALRVFGVKHTVTTEAAWRLVETFAPSEASRQRAVIVRYLSWLSRQPSSQLTGNQKKIREGLGRSGQAGGRPPQRPTRRR